MKVSVIVPVYNSEKYLRDCLDSLVNQTLKDIEIIVVDDASTDKSMEIIMEYKNKYPSMIKVFQNEQNKGQGASRNVGISLATGEYIGFLDSDDYVAPTMFEEMYIATKKYANPDIVSTRLTFVKDNGFLGKTFEPYSNESCYRPLKNPELVLDESPSVCNKIFKRDSLSSEFLESCMWEDVAFTYANLFNANEVVHLNNMGYYYRKSATSGVSAKGFKYNPNLLDTFKVADRLEIDTKKTGRFELLKENIRYMQTVTTLQRVAEVLHWDEPEDWKEGLIYTMHQLITWKYGDWRDLDLASLSMRVGILELDKIQSIVAQYEAKRSEKGNKISTLESPSSYIPDEPENFPPKR